MARGIRRGGRGSFGLLLLAGQIMQIGVDRIPPVTLITVIINVLVFMGLIPNMPSVRKACTSYSKVVYKHEYQCLVLSSIYHLDDMHLYYNMASFIWKGIKLENKLKSSRFAVILIIFSLLTQVVMIGLNYLLYEMFTNSSYLHTCAAGFSAVIFALKVLTTKYSSNDVSIMGFPIFVPAKYACWVELIVIQLLVPNASFTGHLAGILVGLMYTHGPLKKITKAIRNIITGQFLPGITRSQSYTYHAGNTRANETHVSDHSSYNRSHREEDEDLQRAIRESLRDQRFSSTQQANPPSYGWNIPNEPSYYPHEEPYSHSYGENMRGSNPSAPPYHDDAAPHSTPSYAQNNPPYPTDTGPSKSLYPDLNRMPTLERPSTRTNYQKDDTPSSSVSNHDMGPEMKYDSNEVRNARLRRFQNR